MILVQALLSLLLFTHPKHIKLAKYLLGLQVAKRDISSIIFAITGVNSHCSTEAVTKAEECICCKEIDRVGELMSQVDLEDQCITLLPGFHDVCLNRWVLEIASLALKTKAGKSYRTLFSQGIKSESE